jgi:hypothetical protein
MAKRKTYSVALDRSRELGHHSIDMSEELNKTVPKQSILDALILCLNDKSIYQKVRNIIKNNK